MSPPQLSATHRTGAGNRALAWALSALVLALPLVVGAAGKVEVKYIEVEKFADIGRASFDREQTLDAMTRLLQQLGEALPDGRTLRLEITDIDLAGELEPVSNGRELRVLRNRADWPRMSLRYTLLDGQRTVKSGEARLQDMNYIDNIGLADRGRALSAERNMLKRWFDTTLMAR